MALQCLAWALGREGRRGSYVTAKTGRLLELFLKTLNRAVFLGIDLALLSADSIILIEYPVAKRRFLSSSNLKYLFLTLEKLLTIVRASENGTFRRQVK